jgi:iron complex transport system ATP-binding protein
VLHLARELTNGGATVLFSLHDLRVANSLDVIVVLHNGRLRAVGKPAEVLTPKLLAEVFGVQARTGTGLVFDLP